MTDDEAYKLSTQEERVWVDKYKMLQADALRSGYMSEGQLLEASQCVSHIIERNKRLGLQ